MVPGYLLQETAVTILKDLVNTFITFLIDYFQYILIGLALILIYVIVTRLLLRGTVYKTAQRDPMCILTMSGRERSLEYLERFGELKGVDAQVIRYLRKYGQVPKKNLEKTFGTHVVNKLIEDGMISVI